MKKKKTIEQKFERLAEISSLIEGDTPLELAMELYKEGLGLVEECGCELKKHEAIVLELKKNTDGLFCLEPFGETQ